MKRFFSVICLLLGLFLAACGGGGGGGSSDSGGITITGSVSVPGTSSGKGNLFTNEHHAGTLVAGTSLSIFVFKVDDNGKKVGGLLGSTTTDSSGNYSVTLPSGVSLASDLMVQAGGVQIENIDHASVFHCPAVSTTCDMDPATKFATQAMIDKIKEKKGALSNFTKDEIAAFLNMVRASAQDTTLIQSNVADTISEIKTRLGNLVDLSLDGISGSGDTTAPGKFGGVYNLVGFHGAMGPNGYARDLVNATLTINSDGTFSLDMHEKNVALSEACTAASGICRRILARSFFTNDYLLEGTYHLGGGGRIFFRMTRIGGVEIGASKGTVIGFINPTGEIIVIPCVPPRGDGTTGIKVGIGVAIKKGSGISSSTVAGAYNFFKIKSEMPANSTADGSWGRFSTGVAFGVITFDTTSFTGTFSRSLMRQNITCTPGATGCALAATLTNDTATGPFSGTYTASSTGELTLTGTPFTGNGGISADGNFLLAPGALHTDGAVAMALALRQGSDLSTASLNGKYNVAAFRDVFRSTADIRTTARKGVIEFNGSGSFTSKGAITGVKRLDQCISGSPTTCPSITISHISDNFSATGSYSVAANGDLTLVVTDTPSVTLTGAVSRDGSVFILYKIRDSVPCRASEPTTCKKSVRLLEIGLKQ